MTIRYDYDHTTTQRHPYRNQGRWLVQARERERRVSYSWTDVRRETMAWTRWRTVRRFFARDEAEAYYAACKLSGLAQWRVTFGGKRVLP